MHHKAHNVRQHIASTTGLVNYQGIPESLKDYPRWTLWRALDGAKVPVSPSGKKVDPHKKWISYDEAEKASQEDPTLGIGIVLFNDCGVVAIDLDDVDSWHDKAMRVLDDMGALGYSEVSPSGEGYHIIIQADPAEEHRTRHRDFFNGKIEVYSTARFLTVTGQDAEGDLRTLTRKEEVKLDKFMEPLFVEEDEDEDETDYDDENEHGDEDVIFEMMAVATKPKTPGFKAFKKIWKDEDAFDESDDPSDLLTQAVGALASVAATEEQVKRIMLKSAAAPHYVDRKTQKPKMKRWLDSELPKIFGAEKKSRKKKKESVQQAADNNLFERYIRLRGQNKFYDTATGVAMVTEDMDYAHFHELDGQKLTTLMREEGLEPLVAYGYAWKPTPHRGCDEAFKRPFGRDALVFTEGQMRVNTWGGYGVKPIPDDVSPWLNLIDSMFTHEEADHLISRMAFDVQFPHKKCNWHPLIIGVQGSGKGSILEPLAHIFRGAAGSMSEDALKTGYDDEFVGNKIVFLDEIKGVGGSTYERLKMYAAAQEDHVYLLNKKGQGKVPMPALWSFYTMTNHDDALRLEKEERRWFVIKTHRGPMSQNEAVGYHTWLRAGGAEAVFDFLLHYDLSGFDPTMAPMKTEAFFNMAESAIPRWEIMLADYMTTDAWASIEAKGVVNYARLSEQLNSEHRVKSSPMGIRRYLEKNLQWEQPESIRTAQKKIKGQSNVVRRAPATILAAPDSHLHDLRGAKLYEEIQQLLGAGADFHE